MPAGIRWEKSGKDWRGQSPRLGPVRIQHSAKARRYYLLTDPFSGPPLGLGNFPSLAEAKAAANPGAGEQFEFHGAYASKAAAARQEKAVGGFTVPRYIGGKLRWVVLRRYAENPAIYVVGANRGKLMSKWVKLIRYVHVTEGYRFHKFRAGTRLEALPDGSVRIYHPTHRLWMDDGR